MKPLKSGEGKMMLRLWFILVMTSLVLMGCQQTKMSSVPPKPAAQLSVPQPPVFQPGPGMPPPLVPHPKMPPPPPPEDPRFPEEEPRDPYKPRKPEKEPRDPVKPLDPRIVTPRPRPPVVTPINDDKPVNPPPQFPVRPVFRPPSIREPETVQPPPVAPDPRPNPGTEVIVPPPVRPPRKPQPVVEPQPPVAPPVAPAPIEPTRPQSRPQIQPPPPPVAVARPPSKPADWPLCPGTTNGTRCAPGAQVTIPPVPTPPPKPETWEPCPDGKGRCLTFPVQNAQCGPVDIVGTQKVEKAKLDVVFVVDTSASMRGGENGGTGGELAQIARQMPHFVANFPEETDINIGVILGHGTGQHTGKLFKASKSDPAVLSTRQIRNRSDLAARLEAKMKAIPKESKGAQGEALLYSLYQAVNSAALREEIKKQGLFRDDSSLALIMVSDEQDVCFDYSTSMDPETKAPYIPVGKKDSKGNNIPDPYEVKYYNEVCSKAYKGGLLKPGNLHEGLIALKQSNQRLILMGMVYASKHLTPKPGHEDENEMGHGIISFVDLEKGKLVDLGSVQEGPSRFAAELAFLGDYTRSEIVANGNLACKPMRINPLAIDLSTVVAEVVGGGKTIGVFSAGCADQKCGEGKGGLQVVVEKIRNEMYLKAYLEGKVLNQIMNAHSVSQAQVRFTFKTRSDTHPQSGIRTGAGN